MTQTAVENKIAAMPKEQWFTSQDVAGTPNPRIAQLLWSMAEQGHTENGYILISSAGAKTCYMWTDASQWASKVG